MHLGTFLYTMFNGKLVGIDEFGNKYFEKKIKNSKPKRWVAYNGLAEASKVPANWHGWLHHTHEAPISKDAHNHSWIKQHLPNLTGTKHRYLPGGHAAAGGVRQKSTSDYESWTPGKK